MRPSHLLPVVGVTFALLAVSAVRGQQKPEAAPDPKPAALPLTRVVLFNAGVAYFHREGPIDGEAKLELRFPEADVNDLIKSLVLADKDGGTVRAVTYDNRTPVEFTLKSFAVDLTENPTVGQLLHQVRGEAVEVTDKAGAVTTGKIVSVERPATAPRAAADPGEVLNLLTAGGLEAVDLKQAKKVRFVRPELQAEFHKALDVLAAARGDGKKTVSVVFTGNGRRRVAVGYVTEAPMWKPTYRLTVDDKGVARLQGWAVVENTTDEDWTNVKVGLVAGRPMTYQMDLYDPLFVPRPLVEPDLYASLRPPLYQGGLNPAANMGVGGIPNARPNDPFIGGGGIAGIGGGIGGAGGSPFASGGMAQNQGFGGGIVGVGGGNLGQFGFQSGNQFGNSQFGIQGGNFNPAMNNYLPRVPRPDVRQLYGTRLNYDEYLNRVKNRDAMPTEAGGPTPSRVTDPLDPNGGVLAGGASLGDMFEYAIAEPVSLARQKSALLPIVNAPVEGTRVSIYNAKVLAKHPLLGLKLVNRTKLHLAQGPVTVFNGETFAGDARLPDLKPDETRLVSFAIDLGTEVVAEPAETKSALAAVRVRDGLMVTTTRNRTTTKYLIRNRNPEARTVVVEHPVTPEWRLTTPAKPADRTRDFYRFELPVKPGELVPFEVVEEHDGGGQWSLVAGSEAELLFYAKQEATKPAVRLVLTAVLDLRAKLAQSKKALAAEQAVLKEIGEDQARIRANIERVPKDSDAFKRYLKKFDDQETEIEKRQARAKELTAEVARDEKALRDYVETARAE